MQNDLLLTFYGDDFTGSTDAMEALTNNGVPTVLFLDLPDSNSIGTHFPRARAVGVAGVSRSMSPAQMDAELPPHFAALKALSAPLVHYKVCSTFDSSPTVGSIGYATDIAYQVIDPSITWMVVGAPALRRYVAFGNLFATVGDETYRLDRHPTMSRHPVTPMDEADLRLHLGKQTQRKIGLIDLRHLALDDARLDAYYRSLVEGGAEIILFDTLDETHLRAIGRLIWAQRGSQPMFAAASSGLEYALTTYWQSIGLVEKPQPPASVGAVEQLIVVSGSASPGTAAQIRHAEANGFHRMRLDSAGLIDPSFADAERARALERALEALSSGHSIILYSALGPDDPAIRTTKARINALALDPTSVGSRLGAQQGLILRTLLERTGLKRACIAGGDTCGYATRQLDIYALEVLMPVAPGAPLCRAHARSPRFDGLQIALKGGQLGGEDYFVRILRGAGM